MKNLAPLILALVLHTDLYSCNFNSKLIISHSRKERVAVVINDKSLSHSNAFNIDLLPGRHFLRISSLSGSLLYSGYIELPAHTVLYTEVDFSGLYVCKSLTCLSEKPPCFGSENENSENVSFFYARKRLEEIVSAAERLKEIKRYIALEEGISAGKVALLMDLLAAEKHKLELAQFSFPFLDKPQGYIVLKDALILESSKKEFENWVLSQISASDLPEVIGEE